MALPDHAPPTMTIPEFMFQLASARRESGPDCHANPFCHADGHDVLDTIVIEALREQFVAGATEPVRASLRSPRKDRRMLLPAWDGTAAGVKIVTVFRANRERPLASVRALTC